MNSVLLLIAASATLKVEIEGEGYLRFTAEGRTVYARSATLEVRNGFVAASSGERLLPAMAVSGIPTKIDVDSAGLLTITTAQAEFKAGRIRLAKFSAAETPQPSGAFHIARSRGQLGFPGDHGFGTIRTAGNTRATPTQTSSDSRDLVRIKVRARSEVATTPFTLGHIAEIEAPEALRQRLSEVEIGESPGMGVERGLDRVAILGRLRMAKLAPEHYEVTVPAGAAVVRKSQVVSHKQFAETALKVARLEVGRDIELVEDGKSIDIQVPPGVVELTAESVAATRDKVRVIVAVHVDGKRINSRTISFSKPPAIPGVKAGEIVRIRVRSGDAIVESRGKAVSSAFVGDRVPVKSETGVELTGKVVEPGVVEVNP
ncbi:MAG: hypothetical protein HONBIEJF_02769 [Fimbriimonadaceae bacterium]|nr:hypothetical protein [Fimbriimonadaceae bacterium]